MIKAVNTQGGELIITNTEESLLITIGTNGTWKPDPRNSNHVIHSQIKGDSN